MKTISKEMKCKFLIPFVVTAMAVLLSPPLASAAILGAELASFAVLGASGVTNVPTSTIGGNLGSAPNASVGGGYIFTSGSFQQNTALAESAQLQLDTAIFDLSAYGVGIDTGSSLDAYQALNGDVISPGTYTVAAATTPNLAGNLILDGDGFNDAVWIFQMESSLITGPTSNVTVQNVGDGSGVGIYWNVRSDATLNGPTFAGNVLAHGLISSDGNLTINCGRLLSATKQVTLIKDTISLGCIGTDLFDTEFDFSVGGGFDQGVAIGSGGTGGSSGFRVNGVPVPEPGTMMLLGSGLVGLAGWGRKKLRK